MRIALAQINSILGDFDHNAKQIVDFSRRAKQHRCDLIVFPEATLFGYHPMDLLERPSVVDAQIHALQKLKKKIPDNIGILLGAFTHNRRAGKPFYNSAIFLEKNKSPKIFNKQLLPTYDVFDEARHIESGDMQKNVLKYKGKKILITICEDIWAFPTPGREKPIYKSNPIKKYAPKSVDLCVNLSASPFFIHKYDQRMSIAKSVVRHLQCPLVYVNMVGAQDELIFDGGSFAMNRKGVIKSQSIRFGEDLNVYDMHHDAGSLRWIESTQIENIRKALVLGIRDFMRKSGLTKLHLGLSGGIDSAVVACLAVDALGAESVSAIAIPGPYSKSLSFTLAKNLATNLGIKIYDLDINKVYGAFIKLLEKKFGPTKFGLVHENLQARLRGNILMAFANKNNSLLLNTSNKSELASGYGTLYGDLSGGLSPIGDLLKKDVYALANLYNSEREIISKKIISREPSAELRPNQKDSDSLPSYPKLDSAVIQLVEKGRRPISPGEKFLLQALMKSEFKRWQSPPILKVREHSFGQGRRMPLAHRAYY